MDFWNSKKKLHKWMGIALLVVGAGAGAFTFVSKDVQQELTKIEKIDNWVQFSPADKRFSIEFPKSPKEGSKLIEIPSANQSLDYKEMRADESQVSYAVSYIDFPRKWRLVGSNTLLKKSLAILVEHEAEGQKLVSQQITTHNGLPALDYVVSHGKQEIQGRLILSGTTLYRLTATYLPANASLVQHAQFVSTFNLLAHA